jgi:hypothetical protein
VGVSGLSPCKQGHRTNFVIGGGGAIKGFCYLHDSDSRGAEHHIEDVVFFSFFTAEVKSLICE